MSPEFIENLLTNPDMLRMGHGQSAEDSNLGLGWLYYAMVRIIKPRTIVCIGSWRGFVPMIIGLGAQENECPGEVVFIDPSLADDFWKDEAKNREWFAAHGITNITHYPVTTQEFVDSDAYASITSVDLLFVDGLHTAEQACFDHEAFEHLLSEQAVVFFHDSVSRKYSRIYGEESSYHFSVVDYIDKLKLQPGLQVMDFPFAHGLTMVRRVAEV